MTNDSDFLMQIAVNRRRSSMHNARSCKLYAYEMLKSSLIC